MSSLLRRIQRSRKRKNLFPYMGRGERVGMPTVPVIKNTVPRALRRSKKDKYAKGN